MIFENRKFRNIAITILILASPALLHLPAKGQTPGKVPDATKETVFNGENQNRNNDAAASPGIRLKSNDPALGPLRETFSQLFRDVSEVHSAIPRYQRRHDSQNAPK
jgi:hypothetical protein